VINISVEHKLNELEKMYSGMKTAVQRGTASALNKSMVKAKSLAAKHVAARYRLTQRLVRSKMLTLNRATFKQLSTTTKTAGPFTEMRHFVTSDPFVAFTRKYGNKTRTIKLRGVRASIRKGKSGIVKGAFLAPMRTVSKDGLVNQHIGVFKRTGIFKTVSGRNGKPKRVEKIKKMFSISIPGSLSVDLVETVLSKDISDYMLKIIDHEVEFYVGRASKSLTK